MKKMHSVHDHHGDEKECGCGGMCKWMSMTKEQKIELVEKKETKLQKMLVHVQKMKASLKSGEPLDSDIDYDEQD